MFRFNQVTAFAVAALLWAATGYAQNVDTPTIADKNGCKVYNPMPQQEESITWTGDCRNGYAHGNGILDWFVGGQLEERYEAGLELQGWEVKSLRAGKVQIVESYILLKNNEAFLFGALITPLPTVSTHFNPDPTRTRKLLLHREEINKLVGAVERKGYSLVPTALYWKRGKIKLEIGVAKGKKAHDKRAAEKDRRHIPRA